MDQQSPVPGPTLAEKREKTIQLLIDSFASDRLPVEDFEARLDLAHRAMDLSSLEKLTSDLPAVATPQPPAQAAPAPSRVPAPRPASALPEEIREHQFMVAIMGGHERRGPWTPARKCTVLTLMGGAELDYREARLGPGVTEVQIFAMMGGVEIIVPPGVVVESEGFAFMGGFGHGPGRTDTTPPDAPILRVTGVAIMGGVDIHTRLSGESAGDARRRLRDERKRLRRRRRELP
jgi:DUF1707 SHOCT-like domain